MPDQRRFVTVNNLKIAEIAGGEGEPILLLHGWGANADLVWPLAERLIPLGYCVHVIDLPGFGESDAPESPWGVVDYAKLVIAYLDAKEIEISHLFGHSFGGRISLVLGSQYASRFKKIVLANSAGIVTPKPLTRQLRLRMYKTLREGLSQFGAKKLAEQLRTAYNKRYGSTDYQQLDGLMRESFLKVVNQDLKGYAQQIERPTLLIWGDKDDDTPLSYGQTFEKLIPDAGLVVHKGAGHYSYLDRLPETVRIMDYFFKSD